MFGKNKSKETVTTKIASLVTNSGVCIYLTGETPFTMARDHKYFGKLLEALKTNDPVEIRKVVKIAEEAVAFMDGKISVEGGQIHYNGEPLTGALVERILALQSEGHDATGMVNFLENLMQNPSNSSREELYLFLEACGDLPITEDGRFIAYKWVKNNYKDVHSGTIDNSVGQIVKMERAKVDDRRQNTCSHGLHVCSQRYDPFGPKLMLVAVNPRDVVSVPNDYDNGKMRVCEYEVIDEIKEAKYTGFKSAMYGN